MPKLSCQHCGNDFESDRKGVSYCSKKCQNRAHYLRKQAKKNNSMKNLGSVSGGNMLPGRSNSNSADTFFNYIITDQANKLIKAESKIESLTRELDQEKRARFDAEKQAAFKDQEMALALREQDLSKSSTLGGVVQEVISTKEGVQAVAGIIGQMFGKGQSGAAELSGEESQVLSWYRSKAGSERAYVNELFNHLSEVDIQGTVPLIIKFLKGKVNETQSQHEYQEAV